mmetsp:Transcript_16375/g.53331  ORF Transcript_16375/g.53331 Transcript_16375/m.53331 type:complete len:161 (-) Transcript_16375:573-1055(-)
MPEAPLVAAGSVGDTPVGLEGGSGLDQGREGLRCRGKLRVMRSSRSVMRARSSLWYAFSRWRWQQYERSLSMKTAPTMGCAQSQHMVMCEAGRGLENPDAAFSPSSLTQMGASASEAKTLGGAVCSVASRGDRPAPGWSVTSVDAVEDASDLLRASVEVS